MIPQEQTQRAKLLTLVNECVSFLKEIDTLKEDIKNCAEIAAEEHPVSKKDFNALVKAAYDKAKVEEQIEDLQTTISNLEILQGNNV